MDELEDWKDDIIELEVQIQEKVQQELEKDENED